LIQGNEKIKAQKTLSKIESGKFADTDIDSLFMYLRAFSDDNYVFREVADFVAHNDSRNKGLVNKSLKAFYLRMLLFIEYSYHGKKLDISKPIPLYMKELVKYQIDKCDSKVLLTKFNVTQHKLKAFVDNFFKEDKKNRKVKVSKTTDHNAVKAISYCLGFIYSYPSITQEVLLDEIILVPSKNQLTFDSLKIRSQSNKIVICVLAFLNKTTFDFDYEKGFCNISCERTSIPKDIKNEHGQDIFIDHGKLQLHGSITVKNGGEDHKICFPVFVTDLKAEDYCHTSLFSIYSEFDILFQKVLLEGDLSVNKEFKLSLLSNN
jgi:hypothetical protein